MMEEAERCLACDLVAGVRPLLGGVIHRSDGWVVEHCVGPLGIGTLIVKPERHVTAIADLDVAEASTMGSLLYRASQVVTQLCDPDQVYVGLWSHAGGKPGHIHFVVQPIRRTDMERLDAHGPRLQAAMFENDSIPDRDDIEDFVDRARGAW